jgi:hypothetical protein
MFGRRRSRKEEQRQRELSARIASADAGTRVTAATEIAQMRDQEWAVRQLAQALDREPSPEVFQDIVGPFCDALCRDRGTRERVERVFAEHAEPGALVRAWSALMEEFGSGSALEAVDEELAGQVGARLRRMAAQGLHHRGLSGMRRDSFAYDVTFAVAVGSVHDAIRRSAPLSDDEAAQARQETRSILERALALPPGSDERSEVLVLLGMRVDDETWTDWALSVLRIDEALAWCRATDPDRVALGLEALHGMMLLNEVMRHAEIRRTLDRVCVPGLQPHALSQALGCYASLHAERPLQDPPSDLFLTSLTHSDPRVRAAAASGLSIVAPGQPQEKHAIGALTAALDDDPDNEVRRSAATALAYIECEDEANTLAATAVLTRHREAADPYVRAASVEGALLRGEPGAHDRLTAELRRPDVEAVFVNVVTGCPSSLSEARRTELTGLLEQLATDGWAALTSDPDALDPESRAADLEEALASLRSGR